MDSTESGESSRKQWLEVWGKYADAHPVLANELFNIAQGNLPEGWQSHLPSFTESVATRKNGEAILAALGKIIPDLLGGSADLAESTFTHIHGESSFQANNPTGRNFNFGVREHAMAAAVNGMQLHGGVRAIASSFVQFTDYCRPAIRLAALMECPSMFVFTHDSIGLGEDGPTHQPVEHLAAMRAIPNLNTFRPCDGNETSAGYKVALESKQTPTLLVLSRQNLPVLSPNTVSHHPAEQGAYILQEASSAPQLILIGTGSEVQLCTGAREALEAEGIPTRVVSMPSWFLFEKQSAAYREMVLGGDVPVVSVEAGTSFGWAKYSDAQVSIDRFGVSGPAPALFKEFGFTVENVVRVAKELL